MMPQNSSFWVAGRVHARTAIRTRITYPAQLMPAPSSRRTTTLAALADVGRCSRRRRERSPYGPPAGAVRMCQTRANGTPPRRISPFPLW
jgi:hypothetical protein